MPQKKYDLRNQFEQAARRYNNEEERSTRIQAVVDAHHKQTQMPKKYKLPTFDCPACHAKNIMFAGNAVAKNETILTCLKKTELRTTLLFALSVSNTSASVATLEHKLFVVPSVPSAALRLNMCMCSIIESPEHIKTVKSLWALVSFLVRSITILARRRKNIRPCKAFGYQVINIRNQIALNITYCFSKSTIK